MGGLDCEVDVVNRSTPQLRPKAQSRRRGKLGAAATGLLPDEAMRARMILVRNSHAAARILAFPPEPTRIGVSIAVSP